MSSASGDVVLFLNNLTIQFNRYFGIGIFLFGAIGNILNILVLSQKTLRKNPCAWYFLMSSITSLISYSAGLTTRILSGWNLDYSEVNQGFCKARGLTVFAFITATFWLIAMAAVDRYLASSISVAYRQKSTLKNAQRSTIIIVTLSLCLYIQMLFCYQANLINTPSKCYSKSTVCRLLTDLSLALISILFPILLMILFGLKTISNIRQSSRRIQSQTVNSSGQQRNPNRKTDRQLLIMLFSQILILTILSTPLPIQRLYSTITANYSKTLLEQSIANFTYSLAVLMIYLASGISFYIYTISGGNIFRKGLFNLLKLVGEKIFKCQ